MVDKKTKDTQHDKELKEQKKIQLQIFKEAQQFKKQFAERTLKLVTSGFGLVAALAWNELIKELIKVYIEPFFGKTSGLISLLVYAVIVTSLAVIITYQLGRLAENDKDK